SVRRRTCRSRRRSDRTPRKSRTGRASSRGPGNLERRASLDSRAPRDRRLQLRRDRRDSGSARRHGSQPVASRAAGPARVFERTFTRGGQVMNVGLYLSSRMAQSPEDLLNAYLDGELTAEEQAQVEQRLAESADFRQLHDELRAVRTGLESLPTYRLGPDF